MEKDRELHGSGIAFQNWGYAAIHARRHCDSRTRALKHWSPHHLALRIVGKLPVLRSQSRKPNGKASYGAQGKRAAGFDLHCLLHSTDAPGWRWGGAVRKAECETGFDAWLVGGKDHFSLCRPAARAKCTVRVPMQERNNHHQPPKNASQKRDQERITNVSDVD